MGDNSATVDGPYSTKIDGTVIERDWGGNPTRIREDWTGREYERSGWFNTFYPVEDKNSNDSNGSGNTK
jgi:hypothetical protein